MEQGTRTSTVNIIDKNSYNLSFSVSPSGREMLFAGCMRVLFFHRLNKSFCAFFSIPSLFCPMVVGAKWASFPFDDNEQPISGTNEWQTATKSMKERDIKYEVFSTGISINDIRFWARVTRTFRPLFSFPCFAMAGVHHSSVDCCFRFFFSLTVFTDDERDVWLNSFVHFRRHIDGIRWIHVLQQMRIQSHKSSRDRRR